MKNSIKKAKRNSEGNVLISTLVISAIVAIVCLGLASLSMYHYKKSYSRVHWSQAFYHAENAMLEGVNKIADNPEADFLGTFSINGPKMLNLPYAKPSNLSICEVKIALDPMGVQDNYVLTAKAKVGEKTRTITSLIRKYPPSEVFDYEYFLNNWGWWWGSSITGNGPNRSNWDFDFKDNPTLNGHVFATGEIENNLTPVDPFGTTPPFKGIAKTDPLTYVHEGIRRLRMPNIQNLSYYETKAITTSGYIKIGSTMVVQGVQGDQTGELSGIYLEGTTAVPIEVHGTVVIRGDCIAKGYMTGNGTIYVGGNLYIASDLRYKNGPSFTTPPATMTAAQRDAWVDSAIANNKDMIAFAVKESIYGGQVNESDWKSSCYSASTYGLGSYKTINSIKVYIGDERYLGADGIRTTPDDTIKYLDTNGDGTPDSAYYDADEDGVVDTGYNYDTQIKMTDARMANIKNYPIDSATGLKKTYTSISTQGPVNLEGIYYTNHAFATKSTSASKWNGAIICREEAIIFGSSMTFNYDERVNSRYHRKYFENDPNRIVDLGLPINEAIKILDRYEVSSIN